MKKMYLFIISCVIVAAVLAGVSYIEYNDNTSPMFALNESEYVYQISSFEASEGAFNTINGKTYWLVQIDPAASPDPQQTFKGAAIKISGADFNLDDYLDKNVAVDGRFRTDTGEHTYYLTSVRVIEPEELATPTPETEEGVMCTMDAKICPDGTSVGRSGPNCEFAPCPGTS